MREFLTLLEHHAVTGIVVGLPLDQEGAEAEAATAARALAADIARRSGQPVELWDERLTTARALRAVRAMGGSTRGRKDDVDSLAATHVINHPGSFRLYARLRGLAGSLKSGVYLLHQDESWSDVVAALERGRGVEQRFIVREGLRLAEVADLARAQLKIPRDSFLAAAEDSSLLTNVGLPVEAPSAEGYLFPTTYMLPLRIGARELVRVMIHQFTQQWSPEWHARLDSLHFSRHELVTLASIIESEVRYDPDRPFISAVYQNRLKRGMRLEADPTVSYAYGLRPQ